MIQTLNIDEVQETALQEEIVSPPPFRDRLCKAFGSLLGLETSKVQ